MLNHYPIDGCSKKCHAATLTSCWSLGGLPCTVNSLKRCYRHTGQTKIQMCRHQTARMFTTPKPALLAWTHSQRAHFQRRDYRLSFLVTRPWLRHDNTVLSVLRCWLTTGVGQSRSIPRTSQYRLWQITESRGHHDIIRRALFRYAAENGWHRSPPSHTPEWQN